MKTALLKSNNLIGDALNISPALQEWHRTHSSYEIDLLTLDDHAACLYSGMGVPLRVVFAPARSPYDFEFDFDVSRAFAIGDQKKIHITRAYAEMLGVAIETNYTTYIPVGVLSDSDQRHAGTVLLSPFSRSCASRQGMPPNKMLPWSYWQLILRLLRTTGHAVRVLAGPDDRCPELDVSEDEYLTGLSLNRVALIMRQSRLLISVDNGMGHLAATQSTPTILFYPACLGTHWIVPAHRGGLSVMHLDPARVDGGDLMAAVRHNVRRHLG